MGPRTAAASAFQVAAPATTAEQLTATPIELVLLLLQLQPSTACREKKRNSCLMSDAGLQYQIARGNEIIIR